MRVRFPSTPLMTETEKYIRSLPPYKQQNLAKYVVMAERLREYTQEQKDKNDKQRSLSKSI